MRSNPAAREARKTKCAESTANAAPYVWRASRALDCFVAIGERSDAVLSNGYASQ
jgi:hypothetical protein